MSKTIAAALAKAQTEMGKALKDTQNPFFKSSYADLSSVMGACMEALNTNGIAVIQPPYSEGDAMFVKTVFIHGESEERLECSVPLIIGKKDMQGYGSAVTYARRYGLMSMAGISPEDDDGNAAVKSAPKEDEQPKPRKLDPATDRDRLKAAIIKHTVAAGLDKFWAQTNVKDAFSTLPPPMQAEVTKAYTDKCAYLADDIDGDGIPEFGDAK